MKKKRETCKYCGEKMEAKTTRQEFCSDKCRVYWNRERLEPPKKLSKEAEISARISMNSLQKVLSKEATFLTKDEILAKIKEFEEEIPKLGTGRLGQMRKSFLETEIAKYQRQLHNTK